MSIANECLRDSAGTVGSILKLNQVVLIASVRNTARIEKIFETYRPDIVYHAAAHKHVPLMETSPDEDY